MSLTDKAPLSKSLLLVLNGLTVMLTLLPQYQDLFVYHLQAITQEHQVRPGIYKCVWGWNIEGTLKPTPSADSLHQWNNKDPGLKTLNKHTLSRRTDTSFVGLSEVLLIDCLLKKSILPVELQNKACGVNFLFQEFACILAMQKIHKFCLCLS